MKISIQGYLAFKNILGERELDVPQNCMVQELLEILDGLVVPFEFKQPAKHAPGSLNNSLNHNNTPANHGMPLLLLINGVHLRHLPEGLQTALKEGDHVSIFPPLAGG